MALTRPTLGNIAAFDATINHRIPFTVAPGGDQVTANRLTIINQSTGLQVYQDTQTRFPLYHEIPANTLTNGTYYSAYINTFNASNGMSANSNTVQFYCYTQPSFAFTNIPVDGIVVNNTFGFELTYNQAQGELLDRYKYDLYDAQQIFISTSGVRFVGNSNPPPTVLTYEFGGFADNTAYYIKASGVTVSGTEIETALIPFTVNYVLPNVFAIVELSQNCVGGYVTIKSNMTDIDGTSNPEPPIYIDDEAVDLRDEGAWVNWNQNQFDFGGDWTLGAWGKDFNPNENIVTLMNEAGESIEINYRQGYPNGESTLQTYVDCMVKSDGSIKYYIYSNFLEAPLDTDMIQVWLRRVNHIYQIGIYNLS